MVLEDSSHLDQVTQKVQILGAEATKTDHPELGVKGRRPGRLCGDAKPRESKPVFFAILLSMTGPISAPPTLICCPP
jgi:hypothetical protein